MAWYIVVDINSYWCFVAPAVDIVVRIIKVLGIKAEANNLT